MDMDQIHPPRELCTQRYAVTTSAVAAVALPANIVGSGWIRVYAITADVDYKIGPSTMTTVVKDATGNGATVAPTLVAGTYEDVYLTGDTHITFVGSTTGFLVVRKSGQKKTSQ